MKKDYVKPTMRVVQLKYRQHILTSSDLRGVKGVSNSENINWNGDGFADTEDDY